MESSLYRFLLGVLRPDRVGAGFHLFGLVLTFSLPQEGGVVLKARGHIGVVRLQDLLPDRQGTLVKQLDLGIAALGDARAH